jgi:hypothetical protein
MRLSLKESRMVSLSATSLDRKSGIPGPKRWAKPFGRVMFRIIGFT